MSREDLTPTERLKLRDLLQDRWRDHAQLITLLTLARYEVVDADSAAWSRSSLLDLPALETAIDRARARRELVERAMRRLDDGSYGGCLTCGGSIGASRLMHVPEESDCAACRGDPHVRPNQPIAMFA